MVKSLVNQNVVNNRVEHVLKILNIFNCAFRVLIV